MARPDRDLPPPPGRGPAPVTAAPPHTTGTGTRAAGRQATSPAASPTTASPAPLLVRRAPARRAGSSVSPAGRGDSSGTACRHAPAAGWAEKPGEGEGRGSAPRHPPALGRGGGRRSCSPPAQHGTEPSPAPAACQAQAALPGHHYPVRISRHQKSPFCFRKAPCSLPSIRQGAGTPRSISRRPPAHQPSMGTARQEAVPPAPHMPPAAPFSASQAPVFRRAHRGSFVESQMLHPSQTSPGYNTHLEIPR